MTTTTTTFAGPAWDAYLFALKTLELAEVSYETYVNVEATVEATNATDAEIRQLGQVTTLAHNAVVNARRAVIEARRAYGLARDLEDAQPVKAQP